MPFESKKLDPLILGVTSIACSKLFFSLLHDPEGPNLLIVTGLVVVLFLFSWTLYSRLRPENPKKLLLVILAQLVVVISLSFYLK